MDFENELTSKILDPIHGTIRLTGNAANLLI